jgi:hypothetical protein
MLKFLHWYVNKAIDLTIYLYKGFVDYSREDYTGYMMCVCLIAGLSCLLIAVITGLASIGGRVSDSREAARISLFFTSMTISLPLISALLPALACIALLCFVVYLVLTAFDLKDSISLDVLHDTYYKLRSRYLEFKSKRQAKKPIEKKDCAYRSNFCPVCSREYNK